MSQHLADLATPDTYGLTHQDRDLLADDLVAVAVAMRAQANLWRAAGARGLELAIVEFARFADLVQHRANAYRTASPPGGGPCTRTLWPD